MTTGSAPLLVHGRWVVTGASDDDPTLADGAVLVRDGRIETFAAGVANQNPLVNAAGPAEARGFLEALPPDTRQAAEALLPGPGNLQPDEYFGMMASLWQERGRHPRVDLWFGPPGPFWVTDDF